MSIQSSTHNIMFSQVREDPIIEIQALQDLSSNKNRQRVLMVGSGGCTILSLLAYSKIPLLIDVVDCNIEQLLLYQLKKTICQIFNNKNDVIRFFQGQLSPNKYNDIMKFIFDKHLLSPNGQKYWPNHMDIIYEGINQCGIFEQLFIELVDSGWNFDQVFDRNYLISKFGENAVTNSVSREFSDHFSEVMKKYMNKYTIKNNYFYHQIIENKYDYNSDLPYYLNHLDQLHSNLSDKHKIQSFLCDMTQFNIRSNEYDLIQTSNLTDWMSNDQLDSFMKDVVAGLKSGGKVVARRLNGDYSLAEIMGKYLDIQDVTELDKSCFYSEIIIGTYKK